MKNLNLKAWLALAALAVAMGVLIDAAGWRQSGRRRVGRHRLLRHFSRVS
jgi:hypothetical protein